MNELADVIEQTGGQILRSTLVVTGILVLRLAVKKYIPAKWSYMLCLVAAAWLLVPATPPSVASLWRFVPSGMESAILPAEPISKNPGQSLFPEVEVREMGDPVAVETGPMFTSKADIPAEIVAVNLSGRAVALLWTGGIWVAGVVVFGLLLIFRETVVRIGIRRGKQLEDSTLEEVRKRLGITRKIRLIETDSIKSPALAGFFRPVILVAPGFRNTLSEKEIRHVYMHELIHLKRHDVVSRLFMKIALILQWPNPVAWWANRSSLEDVELATDAAVLVELQGPEERSDYGNTLLKVAREVSHGGSPFAANLLGMADAARSNLEKRITGIVSFGNAKNRSQTAIVITVVSVALLSLSIGFPPSVAQEKKIGKLPHEVSNIILPEVEFSETRFADALKVLEDEARKRDPSGNGITIALSDEIREKLKDTEITLKLRNVPVKVALQYTARMAGLSHKVDGNIFTLLPEVEGNDLFTNVYTVPPTFVSGGNSMNAGERRTAKEILSEAGISFPEGTSAIYNPGTSHLIVRNTADQMELVEAYIDSIRQGVEKLIHISVRQFISGKPFEGFAPGPPYDPRAGVSRTFDNEEAMKDFLSGEEVKKQVAEAKQKAEKSKGKGLVRFSPPSVLPTPEIEDTISSIAEQADATDTKLVSVITRSGQRAVIAGEEVGIGVDPVIGADGRSIDINLVLRLLGENKGLLPDTWRSITIQDGQAIAMSGKLDSKRHVLVFISATIIDPAGQRVNRRPKPEPPGAEPQQPQDANWQALVKKADELALSGSQALARGEAELAEQKYREALKILPDRPETEPRQKAYLKQWYQALKMKQ